LRDLGAAADDAGIEPRERGRIGRHKRPARRGVRAKPGAEGLLDAHARIEHRERGRGGTKPVLNGVSIVSVLIVSTRAPRETTVRPWLRFTVFSAYAPIVRLVGGLDASVDFRQVYADVLGNWLKVSPAAILGEQIDPYRIVASA
jgi:hypothetical protein